MLVLNAYSIGPILAGGTRPLTSVPRREIPATEQRLLRSAMRTMLSLSMEVHYRLRWSSWQAPKSDDGSIVSGRDLLLSGERMPAHNRRDIDGLQASLKNIEDCSGQAYLVRCAGKMREATEVLYQAAGRGHSVIARMERHRPDRLVPPSKYAAIYMYTLSWRLEQNRWAAGLMTFYGNYLLDVFGSDLWSRLNRRGEQAILAHQPVEYGFGVHSALLLFKNADYIELLTHKKKAVGEGFLPLPSQQVQQDESGTTLLPRSR